MVNNSNYTDARKKMGSLFTLAPSKPVSVIMGIISAVLIVVGIILNHADQLNILSLAALAVGVALTHFDLSDRFGMARMKRDCVLHRAEIAACVPRGEQGAETYENLLDYGKSTPLSIFTEEPHRTGEYMDVYINEKTGEVMERFFFESHMNSGKKISVLVAGIVLLIVAAAGEILMRMYGGGRLELLLAGILAVGLLFFSAGWYLVSYVKMKHETASAVFAATGMITGYEKKEAMDVEGIPVYEYYPTVSYWQDGEKLYHSPTGYDRKKFPVGSQIDLYVGEDGKMFEVKSMKKALSNGIFSLITAILLGAGVYYIYFLR